MCVCLCVCRLVVIICRWASGKEIKGLYVSDEEQQEHSTAADYDDNDDANEDDMTMMQRHVDNI